MASRIRVKISDASFIKRKLFYLGEKIGRSVVAKRLHRQPLSWHEKVLYPFLILAVYNPCWIVWVVLIFTAHSPEVIRSARMLSDFSVQLA